MSDGSIVDGFAFTIGSDLRRERIGDFDSVGEALSNMDNDECFYVVKERGRVTVVDFFWFRDGDDEEASGGRK